jgi:hypothetical protein
MLMIRHMVVFKWKPEATEDQKQQVAVALRKLAPTIPAIRAYACGPDAGITEGNFDFAVSADFDDEAGYISYRDNPDHRAIITERILPIAAQRAAVQYEI